MFIEKEKTYLIGVVSAAPGVLAVLTEALANGEPDEGVMEKIENFFGGFGFKPELMPEPGVLQVSVVSYDEQHLTFAPHNCVGLVDSRVMPGDLADWIVPFSEDFINENGSLGEATRITCAWKVGTSDGVETGHWYNVALWERYQRELFKPPF